MIRQWWRSHGRSLARLAAMLVIAAQVVVTVWARREGEPNSSDFGELRLPRAVPFDVSNEADPERVIDARFQGWVRVDEEGLLFTPHTYSGVTYATVREAFPGRVHPVGMGFGVASPGPGGFVVEADTVVAFRADRYATASQALVLPIGSDFRLKGLTPEGLEGRWPVAIYDLRIASGAYVSSGDFRYSEPSSVIRVYAHGDPEIFRRLLTPDPWKENDEG